MTIRRLRSLGRDARKMAYRAVRRVVDCVDGFRSAPPAFDGRLPPPDFVNIETTRYCNLSCRMCLPYLAGITTTGPHMPLEDFNRYAEAVFPFVTRFEPSVSGEPTMSKGFLQMLEAARRFGVKIDIITNGTLLNDRMIEKLVPCAGRIRFSVDAAEKTVFEDIRRGADFDRVVANIKKVMARVREMPRRSRPLVGVACTMMEKNIRQLPELVKLAHELGLDTVEAAHVYAGDEEIQAQSLSRHLELAVECIDQAVATARRLGVSLSIKPLGEVMGGGLNAASLGPRAVGEDPENLLPRLHRRDPEYDQIMEMRGAARRTSSLPRPHSTRLFPKNQQPIQICPMLWERSYIHQKGEVRPCCVDGVPIVGNVDAQPFEEVWNNSTLRHMRQRLVRRDPVDACKGCQYIRTIEAPRQIDRYLMGGSVPAAEDLAELEPSTAV